MLSDDDLKKAYWKARSEIGGDAVGLRAVAEAAVKDAVGGDEPVAWMYTDRFGTHFTDEKDEWEIAEGIESVQPLYARPQASAAVPDLSACFMTAESGGGEYKIVLRFQTLAKMQDAHSAMVHWLAASQPEVRNAD